MLYKQILYKVNSIEPDFKCLYVFWMIWENITVYLLEELYILLYACSIYDNQDTVKNYLMYCHR